MAAGTLPEPGSRHPRTGDEIGPCIDEGCGHIDCQGTRDMAAKRCRYCGKPIGYERPFYKEGPVEGADAWTDTSGKRWALAHAMCAEMAAGG